MNSYKVSKFAFLLLEKIYKEPLFDVPLINENLFEQAPDLKKIKVLRQQIFYMKDFLLTCNKQPVSLINSVDSRRHLLFDKQVCLPFICSFLPNFLIHWSNGT